MTRRAGLDWTPLDLEKDPVPGDPEKVRDEKRHLDKIAKQIEEQITMLRKISSSHEEREKGEHADKMRDASRELSEQLEKVKGRYRKVASALNRWAPVLEHAQALSLKALHQAKGPHNTLRRLGAPETGPYFKQTSRPLGETPAQLSADIEKFKAHQRDVKHAQEELAHAHRLLKHATHLRKTHAALCARRINHACDDDVKDSTWDKFKNWVAKYSWLIKDICFGLEMVGAALALLALILSGAEFLLALSALVAGIALAGRTVLAATGNGSWLDVAVDFVALASFGADQALGKLLPKVVDDLVDTAKAVQTERVASLLSQFDEATKTRLLGEYLRLTVPEAAEPTSKTAAFFGRLLLGGDDEAANMARTINGIGKVFEDVPEVGNGLIKGSLLSFAKEVNLIAVNVATISPLVAGGINVEGPGLDPNAEEAGAHDVVFSLEDKPWHDWLEKHYAKPLETEGGLSAPAGTAAITAAAIPALLVAAAL